MRPTLTDVANRARVSPATVSRVLSHPNMVRPETRSRVNEAVAALGYVRDGAARALSSKLSRTIGIVVPTIDNAIFSTAIQALQSRLGHDSYKLLVASHEYNAEAEAAAVLSLLEYGVDGIVLVGAEHTPGVWTLLERTPIPLVLTWSLTPGRDCVGFDNEAAGRLVAKHLIKLGHQHFGMISGTLRNNDRAKARLTGIRSALSEAGHEMPDWRVSQQHFNLAGGRAGLTALLALKQPPTAIIGGNDLLATGCIFEAQARGITVPDDLSVAGFDNLELAQHISPALTTINLPTAELGRQTAELMLARTRNAAPTQTIELPIDLVVRGSTGPAPIIVAAKHRHTAQRATKEKR